MAVEEGERVVAIEALAESEDGGTLPVGPDGGVVPGGDVPPSNVPPSDEVS
jgi:hypothetical protein